MAELGVEEELRPSYVNPVYDGYFADPCVFRHEGVYYAVGTDDRLGDRVFPMLRSEDFVNWEPIPPALERLDPEFGNAYWAPEVAENGGTFYLYYSVGHEDRGHQLRVAASDRPEGPYHDLGTALIDARTHPFAIDAHPFLDRDGQWYLYYARDFLDTNEKTRAGTALAVDRLLDMTRLAGDERVVMRATQDWQRFMRDRPMYGSVYDWHTLEGPYTVLHGGRYYCFYSGGRWENETYGLDYAESDDPLGPWEGGAAEDSPRVLRTIPGKVIGPGHNSVAVGPNGEPYLVYHAWDPAMTRRRMFIDRLVWTEDGPRSPGPTTSEQKL